MTILKRILIGYCAVAVLMGGSIAYVLSGGSNAVLARMEWCLAELERYV